MKHVLGTTEQHMVGTGSCEKGTDCVVASKHGTLNHQNQSVRSGISSRTVPCIPLSENSRKQIESEEESEIDSTPEHAVSPNTETLRMQSNFQLEGWSLAASHEKIAWENLNLLN